ncbi:hypothetical protein UFOVP672_5 [uncultured Caudovirales phage]|uniref:Uncharacterized protein n=1 Tax=uncultured Caudovirales phage TaxID=2100421 RepID=A0A6J5N8F7_9CAUD|nr:hypothetical protein UFOVP672_5 [uncultured Caudovirales phage]
MALTAIPVTGGATAAIPNTFDGGGEVVVTINGGTTVDIQSSADGGTTWVTALPSGVTNVAASQVILWLGHGLLYRVSASATTNFYLSYQ